MKVAFIGLGIMGSRMAANLLKAGHELTVYNRTASKAADLKSDGASVAASPAEAVAGAEVVITMLSTPEVVRETALGENGFLTAMPADAIWINSSTVNPSFTREMAAAAKAANVPFVDAPVAGTKGPAETGNLLFLAGGEAEHIAKCQPLFDIMGTKTMSYGEAGQGSAIKMLINLMLAQSVLAFSEATVLGESLGLSREQIYGTLLQGPVVAPVMKVIAPRLGTEDDTVNFPLRWMQKDIHLATTSAWENGVAMPSLNAAKEVYQQAIMQGLGDHDFSAVFDFVKG